VTVLVIDGKNSSNDGMVIGKNISDISRVTVGRQRWKIGKQGRSAAMMA
jgi:hypothetical protein